MENYFDFYTVMAFSESKKAIKKVPNVTEYDIIKVVNDRWPKPSYKARIAFIDGQIFAAKQQADKLMASLPEISGVMYYTNYHARD